MFKNILFLLLIFLSLAKANEPEIKLQNPDRSPKTHNSGFGVEINPVRVLFYTDDDEEKWRSFSGGISYFDDVNGAEIALPLFYEYYEDKYSYYLPDGAETLITVGLHYRKFLSQAIDGPYLGVLGRYTYLDGKLENDHRYAKTHKFGLGLEVGYRVMNLFDTPLYWGASLCIGRHFGNNNNIYGFESDILWLDDPETFIDMELLKFGYRF